MRTLTIPRNVRNAERDTRLKLLAAKLHALAARLTEAL